MGGDTRDEVSLEDLVHAIGEGGRERRGCDREAASKVVDDEGYAARCHEKAGESSEYP